MKRWLIAVAAATGLLMGGPARATQGKALVIGIDRYEAVKPLSGAANDARAVQDFAVRRWGFRSDSVRLLLNEEATHDAILAEMDRWLVEGTKPGDTVLLYFSGHGHWAPDRNGDERADDPDNPANWRDEALAAYDTRPVDGGGYRNLVLDDDIAARLEKLTGRRVVLIVDSCHSGTISRSLDGGGRKPGAAVRNLAYALADTSRSATSRALERHPDGRADLTDASPGIITFTAASALQLAEEHAGSEPRRGVFTEALLRGADGAADANGNGTISLTEILEFTRGQADAYCRAYQCTTGMTPTLEAPPEWLSRDLMSLAVGPTVAGTAVDAVADTLGPSPTPQPVLLSAEPAASVRLGQKRTVTVTSPIDGKLVVLDFGPDNTATLLYPNRFSEARGGARRIRAGKPMRLPDPYHGYSLPVAEPVGQGRLVALVIQDDVSLDRLEALMRRTAQSRGPFAVEDDPFSLLGELGRAMLTPWTQGLTRRGVAWAIGHLSYDIVGP